VTSLSEVSGGAGAGGGLCLADCLPDAGRALVSVACHPWCWRSRPRCLLRPQWWRRRQPQWPRWQRSPWRRWRWRFQVQVTFTPWPTPLHYSDRRASRGAYRRSGRRSHAGRVHGTPGGPVIC